MLIRLLMLVLVASMAGHAFAQACLEYHGTEAVCDSLPTYGCGGCRCNAQSCQCFDGVAFYRIAGEDFWMDDPNNPGNLIPRTAASVRGKVPEAGGLDIVDFQQYECYLEGNCTCQPGHYDNYIRCNNDIANANPIPGTSPILGGVPCP
jgi:hypothetical protein